MAYQHFKWSVCTFNPAQTTDRGVTIHIPSGSILFWLFPVDFDYFHSIM